METLVKRVLGGILVFWAGLHFIGLCIWFFGGIDPRSPVLALLSGLFGLEFDAVKMGLFAILAVAGGIILIWAFKLFYPFVAELYAELRGKVFKDPSPPLPPVPLPMTGQYSHSRQPWGPVPHYGEAAHSAGNVHNAPMSQSTPSTKTAEELKEKAIEQIIKGY